MTVDKFLDLLFETLRVIVTFCAPYIGLYLVSLMFPSLSKNITRFISDALKSEFRTSPGKINLIGMFLIVLLFLAPGVADDVSGYTKIFVFGFCFLVSLLIANSSSKKRRETNRADE